jgi:F-type H+-transporting ATPase subunit a
MTDLSLVDDHGWYFGRLLGLEHHFFTFNSSYILHTWIIIGILLLISLVLRLLLNRVAIVRQMTMFFIKSFSTMLEQSIGYFSFEYFCFVTALFVFIAACNLAPLIPWLEEPTQDLNTTVALGFTSFFYIQIAAVKKCGLWHYIKGEFFSPFFLFPLHVVGKIASVMSISLRLFGNIFGGAIISKIYFSAIQYSFFSNGFLVATQLFASLGTSILVIMFFTVLEGLLQAFVFTMLTLTYLAIAVRNDSST